MSARSAMTQRMVVQRDVAQVDTGDDYEHTSEWTTLFDELPCRYWVRTGVQMFARETVTANIEAVLRDARVICPMVDINEGDRILQITDRQGNVQVQGPLNIRGKEPRFSGEPHLELLVREVK